MDPTLRPLGPVEPPAPRQRSSLRTLLTATPLALCLLFAAYSGHPHERRLWTGPVRTRVLRTTVAVKKSWQEIVGSESPQSMYKDRLDVREKAALLDDFRRRVWVARASGELPDDDDDAAPTLKRPLRGGGVKEVSLREMRAAPAAAPTDPTNPPATGERSLLEGLIRPRSRRGTRPVAPPKDEAAVVAPAEAEVVAPLLQRPARHAAAAATAPALPPAPVPQAPERTTDSDRVLKAAPVLRTPPERLRKPVDQAAEVPVDTPVAVVPEEAPKALLIRPRRRADPEGTPEAKAPSGGPP